MWTDFIWGTSFGN